MIDGNGQEKPLSLNWVAEEGHFEDMTFKVGHV